MILVLLLLRLLMGKMGMWLDTMSLIASRSSPLWSLYTTRGRNWQRRLTAGVRRGVFDLRVVQFRYLRRLVKKYSCYHWVKLCFMYCGFLKCIFCRSDHRIMLGRYCSCPCLKMDIYRWISISELLQYIFTMKIWTCCRVEQKNQLLVLSRPTLGPARTPWEFFSYGAEIK